MGNTRAAEFPPEAGPIGVILAGGAGRRIGGAKATVELQGRPLISYPLEAMRKALGEVTVIAKADTELPSLPGVTVWVESERRRHPLVGIEQALALAGGRAVLVCAVDLPFVTAEVIRRIAQSDPDAAAAVAHSGNEIQPLLGCYRPRALEMLAEGGESSEEKVREAIAAIEPVLVDVEDPQTLFNVNSPDDLLQAAAMLDKPSASRR